MGRRIAWEEGRGLTGSAPFSDDTSGLKITPVVPWGMEPADLGLFPFGFRTSHFTLWLLPVVVALVGLGRGKEALSSTLAAASAIEADEHAQYCKCGDKCRVKSCCCGRRSTAGTTPERVSADLPGQQPDRSPCLDSGPCGDPAGPSDTPRVPSSRLALVVKAQGLTLAGIRESVISAPAAGKPIHQPVPLERPPRLPVIG